MSCTSPLYAVKLGINPDTKKNIIKFLPVRADRDYFSLCKLYGSDNVMMLPCGKCLSCKMDHAKAWSIRCCLEASFHSSNWFITLTYNNSCCPERLSKKDLQHFIKTVRNRFGSGIRYFACGEYGSSNYGTHRPHYHLILFGLELDDIKHLASGAIKGNYFDSKKLKSCWPFGFVNIGEVSFSSCSYVARYCVKKLHQDEFILMSKRPGLGEQYFLDHYQSIYDTDSIVFNFGSFKQAVPPKYFDKLLAQLDPMLFDSIKTERINRGNSRLFSQLLEHGLCYSEQLLTVKDDVLKGKVKSLKRRVI